jgi:hypothetical protein
MDVLKEQRVCIKFCQKLGKTATETYEMLRQAFGETALSLSKTFEWYSRFINGRTSIDDDPYTGRQQRERPCQCSNPWEPTFDDLKPLFFTKSSLLKLQLLSHLYMKMKVDLDVIRMLPSPYRPPQERPE